MYIINCIFLGVVIALPDNIYNFSYSDHESNGDQ